LGWFPPPRPTFLLLFSFPRSPLGICLSQSDSPPCEAQQPALAHYISFLSPPCAAQRLIVAELPGSLFAWPDLVSFTCMVTRSPVDACCRNLHRVPCLTPLLCEDLVAALDSWVHRTREANQRWEVLSQIETKSKSSLFANLNETFDWRIKMDRIWMRNSCTTCLNISPIKTPPMTLFLEIQT
jgi:hypothetical protein